MSSFYNPIFLSKVLKSYLFEINRLRKINNKELRNYQNKQIKNMIKFAYTVPLYHDKYKKLGVHPEDIKTIKDLNKFPTISKDDFKNYYPNGIVSSKVNKNKLIQMLREDNNSIIAQRTKQLNRKRKRNKLKIIWSKNIPNGIGNYLIKNKKSGAISNMCITVKDLSIQKEDETWLGGVYYSQPYIEDYNE